MGTVFDAYPAGNGAYAISFSKEVGTFRFISYDPGWYIGIIGECVKSTG